MNHARQSNASIAIAKDHRKPEEQNKHMFDEVYTKMCLGNCLEDRRTALFIQAI